MRQSRALPILWGSLTMTLTLLALVPMPGLAGGLQQEEACAQLVAALGTPDWRDAADDLAGAGDAAVGALARALRDARPEKRMVQARAVDVLIKIGTTQAIDAMVDCLQDRRCTEHARAFAALGVSSFPSERVADVLSVTLQDPIRLVRWKSAEALEKLGLSKAAGPLCRALSDEDEHVRAAAAKALGAIRAERLPPELIEVLKDDSWLVRSNARNAALQFGWPASRPLIAALAADSPPVRWQSAWALGKLGAVESGPQLVKLLNDPDAIVRNEAAVALSRMRPGAVDGLLTAALASEHEVVRREAIWILGELGTEKARAALTLAQAAGPTDTRKRVSEAIQRMEDKPRLRQADLHKLTALSATSELSGLPLYPYELDARPDIPSPCLSNDGREIVTVMTASNKCALIPVTVENGKPLDYRKMSLGKGRQLSVDVADFPSLARKGLHAESELERTKTITDRSVGLINELGRPGRLSGAGFLSQGEGIISVLTEDNRLVERMDLTHPQLARPLFHVWNVILAQFAHQVRGSTFRLLYNGKTVFVKWEGSRGWQESLFEDEVLGMYQIETGRQLSEDERAFLRTHYPNLTPDEMDVLIGKLSTIQTGEMVPYYIHRYGFYEGHTDYRADPIAIALVFSLRSLSEIEEAFPGQLYKTLLSDFTEENVGYH